MSTRRSSRIKIYLGIDPGTLHTGLCVCSVSGVKRVRVDIQHLEVVTTSSKQTKQERFDKITARVCQLIDDFGVDYVICEAFEVRGWQKPRTKSTVMSKLINEISQAVFMKKTLFMLSSPDIKKDAHLKTVETEMQEEIYRRKVGYFDHAVDAIRHVLYWTKVRGIKWIS
jgi:hypothetical protein